MPKPYLSYLRLTASDQYSKVNRSSLFDAFSVMFFVLHYYFMNHVIVYAGLSYSFIHSFRPFL